MTNKESTNTQNEPAKTSVDPFPGYPEYPEKDDIYANAEEVRLDTNPPAEKILNTPHAKWNEKDFKDEKTGDDLDVPGSEVEELGEEIPGKEDEENEYFSLGGDDHEDLDEDNADRQ
jgi:hypothetical protein